MLSAPDGAPIDSVTFGRQFSNVSQGRTTDWFAGKGEYAKLMHEDMAIREALIERLGQGLRVRVDRGLDRERIDDMRGCAPGARRPRP